MWNWREIQCSTNVIRLKYDKLRKQALKGKKKQEEEEKAKKKSRAVSESNPNQSRAKSKPKLRPNLSFRSPNTLTRNNFEQNFSRNNGFLVLFLAHQVYLQ